jgi:hypothetical protein
MKLAPAAGTALPAASLIVQTTAGFRPGEVLLDTSSTPSRIEPDGSFAPAWRDEWDPAPTAR